MITKTATIREGRLRSSVFIITISECVFVVDCFKYTNELIIFNKWAFKLKTNEKFS